MELHWITIGIILLTVAVSFRGTVSDQEFLNGVPEGGRLSPLGAALGIFAVFTGAFMLFGVSRLGYEAGLSYITLGLAYIFGLPLASWIARKLENKGIDVYEPFAINRLVQITFGNKSSHALFLLLAIVFTGILSAQFIALATLSHKGLGLSFNDSLLSLGAVLTLFYVMKGGKYAVLRNDKIQGLLEFSSCVILLVGLVLFLVNNKSIVSFDPLHAGLGGSRGIAYAIIGPILILLTFAIRPDLWDKVLLVESRSRFKALVMAGVLLFVFYAAMGAIGTLFASNREAFPASIDPGSNQFTLAIGHFMLQPLFFQVLLAALIVGLLSTIDAYIFLTARLYAKVITPKEGSPKESRVQIQAASFIAFGAAVLFTFLSRDIIDILSANFAALGMCVPIALFALKPRTQRLPDWVGYIPLYSATIVLIVAIVPLRHQAFLAVIATGWLLFLICYVLNRITSKHRTGQ